MMVADEDDGGGGSDNTARDGDKGDDVRAAPNFLVRIKQLCKIILPTMDTLHIVTPFPFPVGPGFFLQTQLVLNTCRQMHPRP